MKAYTAWLAERRQENEAMLWVTDEEIAAVVDKLDGPTAAREIMDRLVPGERLQGEVARFSYQLTRLAREGRIARLEVDGKPAWARLEHAA